MTATDIAETVSTQLNAFFFKSRLGHGNRTEQSGVPQWGPCRVTDLAGICGAFSVAGSRQLIKASLPV